MEDLSLHILDIVENSIRAEADKIRIRIIEDTAANLLVIKISDNGKGMDDDILKHSGDPFFTTKSCRRVGLGIPLLAQAAKECNGDLEIKTEKDRGASVTARFQYDHIDRKPLGDIEKTLVVLIASNPEIDFIYEHTKDKNTYKLDTADIKKDLDDVPITNPEVIKIIKKSISAWLNKTDNVIQ